MGIDVMLCMTWSDVISGGLANLGLHTRMMRVFCSMQTLSVIIGNGSQSTI